LPRRVALFALVAVALAGCAGDEPSIRSQPVPSSTTTPSTTLPAGSQTVEFGGLTFLAPSEWPVHDLAADPNTCIRADEHAVYLGPPGDTPDCPARILGHTETLWVGPLEDRRQVDAARATLAATINGLPARVDPEPEVNGALTVLFTEQELLVIITFGDDRSGADAILASVRVVAG
jgi:hypothetical protein